MRNRLEGENCCRQIEGCDLIQVKDDKDLN